MAERHSMTTPEVVALRTAVVRFATWAREPVCVNLVVGHGAIGGTPS
jgi:hypothetical protein